MRRPPTPLLTAAACLAAGSVAQHATEPPFGESILIVSTLASIAGVWIFGRRPAVRSLAVVILLVVVSFNNAFFRAHFGQSHLARHIATVSRAGIEVEAGGEVASAVSRKPGRTSFEMDGICLTLSTSCIRLSGKLRVSLAETDHFIAEGDRVVVEGLLRAPPFRRNPADFDVAAWLASNDLSGTLTNARLRQRRRSNGAYHVLVNRTRSFIRRAIRRAVPPGSHDLPEALLLGDRSSLTDETRDDFARSGLMHLLAISGLHVLFVGMMLHRLLRPLLMRMRWPWLVVETVRAVATLTLLTLYALVSGAGPSVMRAVIMTGFLLTGTLARSVSNPLNALGGAAFAILLFDPSAVFRVGFQLSFSAVAGLLMMGRGLDADLMLRIRRPFCRFVASGISASVVATLATAPILVYRFGYVGVAGIVLNLIAIPLGATLLCASILTCLAASVSTPLALPLGAAVDLLTTLLKYVAHIGGASDALLVTTGSVAVFTIVCTSSLVFLLARRHNPIRKWTALLALSTPCCALLYTLGNAEYTPKVDILFLDVGHGDAAIVRLPDRRTLLIDAGDRHRFRDEGHRTVIPNLAVFGRPFVNLAVISHPHSDHLGGLPAILHDVPVRCVADNGEFSDTALYAESARLIDSVGICHRSLAAGDTIDLGPLVRLLALAPIYSDQMTDINDRSVVVKIIFGETSFLFTGDIEKEAENLVVRQYGDLLASDVIKVPHHGSRTSSTAAFITRATRPNGQSTAVISVGSPDKYGLPDEEVVERWRHITMATLTTYQTGAVWVQSNGRTVRRIHWR